MWQKLFSQPDQSEVSIPKGDPSRGKTIYFEECGGCHSIFQDPATQEAPALYGILNKKAGSAFYSYSKAIKKSGIVWSQRNLFLFLANPRRFLPGNRMIYGGLPNAQKRADLIAYLKILDDPSSQQ